MSKSSRNRADKARNVWGRKSREKIKREPITFRERREIWGERKGKIDWSEGNAWKGERKVKDEEARKRCKNGGKWKRWMEGKKMGKKKIRGEELFPLSERPLFFLWRFWLLPIKIVHS